MQALRIFISSPGDVKEERERAKDVVQMLRRRYARKFTLVPVVWEDLPLEPDMSFQQGIDLFLQNPGVDVAVFILWSRLGSPLGASIRKADGSAYRSGTEREYDLMIQARAQTRAVGGIPRPRMIVYTRRDQSAFEARLRNKTTSDMEEMVSQKKLAESFMKETFNDFETGENISAYHPFTGPVNFTQRLRTHLQAILDEIAGDMDEVIWDVETQGPPFLGLDAFQPEHAEVFFGREEEILEARNSLKEKAGNGCAFLLLSGASGSGKSSLARAGILPEILAHEPDEHAEVWKSLIVTPSELGPDPILSLLNRLTETSLLPELSDQVPSLEKLASDLTKDAAGFFDYSFSKAIQAAANRLGGSVRFLIVLDQLEELFTKDALTKESRTAFLSLIETLARSGHFWIIATIRSDFYQEIQSEPALVRMKEGRGLLDVLPPQPDAIARLIEEPARLAGLTFEEKNGQRLSSRILRDAVHHAELLPLLEFVLLELSNHTDDKNQLTHAAYDILGGVEGALRRKAEATFKTLPKDAQESLGQVLQALVTLGEDSATGGESDKPIRLRARLEDFPEETPPRQLIEAFTDARLFTTAQFDGTTEPTVTVAHESLLRAWDRVEAWVETNRDFLQQRRRLRRALALWEQNDRHQDYLLSPGLPLAEALRMQGDHRENLDDSEIRFITSSEDKKIVAERRSRRMRRAAVAALSSLSFLAVVAALGASLGWIAARKSAREAGEQAQVAINEARRADRERDNAVKESQRSQLEEGRAWLERAKLSNTVGDNLNAVFQAARAVGFHGYGNDGVKKSEHPSLLGQGMTDPALEKSRLEEKEKVVEFIDTLRPTLLPIWSSPISTQHVASVESVVYSPDGSLIASGSGDHSVKIWDTRTGKQIHIFESHELKVRCVAFNSDGTLLASASEDQSVIVWDIKKGTKRYKPGKHSGYVTCVAFSPDDRIMVTGSEDHSAKLWNVSSGEEIGTLKGHDKAITSLAFSPSGDRLITASKDGSMILWDTKSLSEVRTFTGHENEVRCVKFSPDGTLIASASSDGKIKLWDPETGTEKFPDLVFPHPGSSFGYVNTLDFSPDGKRLACATGDFRGTNLRLWDLENLKEIQAIEGNWDSISSIDFNPDGSRVACGASDGTIRIWDATLTHSFSPQAGHAYAVAKVAFNPEGTRVASASADGTLKIWDLSLGRELHTLSGHSREINCMAYSPDGRWIATGSNDNSIILWDAETGSEIHTLRAHTDRVLSLSFSPDGLSLVSGSRDHHILLWNCESGEPMKTFSSRSTWVTGISFSPDGKKIVAGLLDGTIDLIDSSSGEILWSLKGHSSDVGCVAFSPDGNSFATGSMDGTIKIWDGLSNEPLSTPEKSGKWITSLAFNGDGSRLASATTGSFENFVGLWDVKTGKLTAKLPFENFDVTAAFSSDGNRIVTGSSDNSVRVWDVSLSGHGSRTLDHSGVVSGMAYSPDGTILASVADSKLWIWDASSAKQFAAISSGNGASETICFSRDGRYLATGTYKIRAGTIKHAIQIRDAASATEIKTFQREEQYITSLDFDPETSRLVSTSAESTLKIWDISKGDVIREIKGPLDQIENAVFNPDGTQIASWSVSAKPLEVHRISIWSVDSGEELQHIDGQGYVTGSLTFSPDGKRLAGVTEFGKIQYWDLGNLQRIDSDPEFSFSSKYLAMSPDLKHLAKIYRSNQMSIILQPVGIVAPDILGIEASGLVKFEGKTIEQQHVGSSLYEPLNPTTGFFEISGPSDTSSTPLAVEGDRLRRWAESNQWRAAMNWWNKGGGQKFTELERPYLTLLLNSANDPFAIQGDDSLKRIFEETRRLLSKKHLQDPLVGPGIPNLVKKAVFHPSGITDEAWLSFLKILIDSAPLAILETIAASLSSQRRSEEISPEQVHLLNVTALQLVSAYPDSPAIMEASLKAFPAGDPKLTAIEDRFLQKADASYVHFSETAYAAAKQGDAPRARRIVEQGKRKFPEVKSVHQMAGWTYILLQDFHAALASFETCIVLIGKNEDEQEAYDLPDYDSQTGLSLSQWFCNQRENGIESYRILIVMGRRAKLPVAWNDPKKIAGLNFTEPEKVALEAIRAATIAKHPEFAPDASNAK
ncbi:MAG: AAA family ATPase [Verrucomicrobiota bacterium]